MHADGGWGTRGAPPVLRGHWVPNPIGRVEIKGKTHRREVVLERRGSAEEEENPREQDRGSGWAGAKGRAVL